ncbi:MAG: uracil-DNA glycosylase [Candidatus Omnitrophica bacterium]|nr:uracil-DNA glycosylase [Candidatus Omnitrophota bacterium]
MRSTGPQKSLSQKANCRNCAHFYITWDKNFPYGCRIMGFKTRRLPCMTVYESSGMDCQSFQPKVNKK